ncbi:hypothetical protein FEE95_12405 [Maribacter algarum]|uniref:Uncharacterized protein n=1 Tax=Maribacter algarum (ex Zhang et al. 2020) TaxID=2578118 RepID=A0A5S3PRI8_9FLAO|nr:hypothetical protein [Maribacter algarum]TMM57281.1 hypothetical protein FEE95_12405 [Maribacter algarum]
MKKHRNFIVFYSLWLAGIFGIFVSFGDNRPEDEFLETDTKVCTVAKDLEQNSTKSFDKKKCQHKEL